jgi:hypothetical protein
LIHFWKDHFLKKQAETHEKLAVGTLRTWINDPKPMGLPKILENLIILSFSVQTNRVFFDENNPVEPALDDLKDHFRLKTVDLPSETDWGLAIKRAGAIFGITQSPLLNAANVAKFSDQVKAHTAKYKLGCDDLFQVLNRLATTMRNLNPTASRLSTAAAAKTLLHEMEKRKNLGLVNCLANWKSQADPHPTDAALGSSITKAGEVRDSINQTKWSVIETAEKL